MGELLLLSSDAPTSHATQAPTAAAASIELGTPVYLAFGSK
jgi:hypothetical protein